MKLSEIKPNPNNPRVLRDDKFTKLVKSLKDFPEMMLKRPIVVDETMTVLGGNMRLRALQHIFGKGGEIPDAWVSVAEGWTEEQKREFIIKDNAAFGEWDWDALANEWDAGDLAEWGIDFPDDWASADEPPAEAQEDDFDPETPVDPVCKAGDIWQLGRHRLMCGDSTDAGSVALLMDGKKADMCFTDPPYKIESGGGGESEIAKSLTVQKSDIDFISGFDPTDFLKILPTVFDKNMNAYVFCNKDLLPQYLNWAVENGYGFNVLIWKKPSAIPIKDAHRPDIEYLLFFRKKAIWNYSLEGVNYSRCLEYSRVQRSEGNGNHPTPKPIALIGNELQISSNKGSIVLDLFGGSGSSLIAAEQLNRTCYMMELDPHYCDVIIARWEKLTGKKAERITEGMQ